MKLYELDYLVSTNIPEKEASSLNEKFKSLIEKEKGNIKKSEVTSEINLAYQIQKQDRAFLATIVFELEADKINSLKKEIEKESNVLRYLLFKKKVIKEEKKSPRLKKIVKPIKETKVELKKIEEKLEKILHE